MSPEIVLMGFYLIILLYAVIVHEVSHGVVALWLGDNTAKYAGRLSLRPGSHIDPIGSILIPILMLFATGFKFAFGWAKPVPYNPYNLRDQRWGPVGVALAGPGSNFLVALIAAIVGKFLPVALAIKIDIMQRFLILTQGSGEWTERWGNLAQAMSGSLGAIFFGLLLMIIFWNVILGVFNLVPIPPLDGSKLIFSIFNFRPETVMLFEQYGFLLLLILILSPLGSLVSIPMVAALSFFFGLVL
jgi:Zn-dependent protease